MTDAVDLPDPAAKASLVYPCGGPPARGRTLEVAPGVHWLRMPLPYALDHINLWVLDDGDRWALVDTGVRTDDVAQAWREAFAASADPRPLSRVIVTHMHPDHVGLAGWLTRKFGVELWMTRLEYLTCRVMVSDTGREAPPEALEFCRRAGWDEGAVEGYKARFGHFGRHIHPLPDRFRRLHDGQRLPLGSQLWRVVVGSGHSPEHACLYNEGQGVLISGDQVLPRISSNVSVHPTEPDENPMADWLASLAKIKAQVPDDVLVLPAHNEAFRGLHARLDYLAATQLRTLARLCKSLTEPRRTIDVFGALFARAIGENDAGLLNLATGESQACLNYLLQRGEITRSLDADGVAWYRK